MSFEDFALLGLLMLIGLICYGMGYDDGKRDTQAWYRGWGK